MTQPTVLAPLAIERGLRSLRGIPACVVEGKPAFDEDEKKWILRLCLRRDREVKFIGSSTTWYIVIDSIYPFGTVAVYPATEGGLSVTYPHQIRNTVSRKPRVWRDGKLCLDSPFAGERGKTAVRDPVGDVDARLRWHIERAIVWLDRAANDQLQAANDPFELPYRPLPTSREWKRRVVVHDEDSTTLAAWDGREGSFGIAHLGVITDADGAVAVLRFEDHRGKTVRAWAGREPAVLAKEKIRAFWWLFPQAAIVPPWQAPTTWRELRAIGESQGLDVDSTLRWLSTSIGAEKACNLLLVGYAIPRLVSGPPSEVHWDTVLIPPVGSGEGKPLKGYRPNARGWWHRDRHERFGDDVPLEYLRSESWSSQRLQARGRLPREMCNQKVVLLGVGALGSVLAEMLVRAGATDIALVDGDQVEAGNVCRHTATLADVGKKKVQVVAQRLRQISPAVRVVEVSQSLGGEMKTMVDQLEPYDVVIDCSASDDLAALLSRGWWSVPRLFVSFSLGYGAKQLYSFGVSGHAFPQQDFVADLRPWIEHDAATWPDKEMFEGAGCWSPFFPARYDDVLLAASVCVKEIETLIAGLPTVPRFRVFVQNASDEGFNGFVPAAFPPAQAKAL